MLTETIKRLVDEKAALFRQELANETIKVQVEPREWEAFEGRTTRRKSPTAPMQVVEKFRDNIDSGDAVENTIVVEDSVVIDVDYASELYEDKPIFEEMLSQVDLKEVWNRNATS